VYVGDRVSRLSNRVVTARWIIVLGPSKQLKWMDMKDADVPGQTLLCIYKIEGDTLTFAFRDQPNATDRPKDFRPHHLRGVEVWHRKRP
jgi:uncharacterized protein (TIGR03067 family)